MSAQDNGNGLGIEVSILMDDETVRHAAGATVKECSNQHRGEQEAAHVL